MAEKIVIGPGDAHIIIDMENDFDETGALPVLGVPGEPTREEVLKNIAAVNLLPFGFRAISLDEHPEDHIEFSIFGPHCVKGTAGAEIIAELIAIRERADFILVKGQHPAVISYSIETSDQHNAMVQELRENGIKRIFMDGHALTHCLGRSAIALVNQLFDVYILRGATRSVDPKIGLMTPGDMNTLLEIDGVKSIALDNIAL